jgi:hypothetical protein
MKPKADDTAIERRLVETRQRVGELEKNLEKARSELEAAISARRECLFNGGDDRQLSAAEKRVADAERQLATLQDAYTTARNRLPELESALADERDQQARQAEADAINGALVRIAETHASFRTAAKEFLEALRVLTVQKSPELTGLADVVANAVAASNNLIPMAAHDLHGYAADVLRGGEARGKVARIKPPTRPAPRPQAEPSPTGTRYIGGIPRAPAPGG